MKLSFIKGQGPAAEIATLKSQLESAKRRITELTLDNIQKANEIAVLQDYRGISADVPRALPSVAKAANSDSGLLFDEAS